MSELRHQKYMRRNRDVLKSIEKHLQHGVIFLVAATV